MGKKRKSKKQPKRDFIGFTVRGKRRKIPDHRHWGTGSSWCADEAPWFIEPHLNLGRGK